MNLAFERPTYTLWQLLLYFLRLSALGFGGPVALTGYMHHDLVNTRQRIIEADYKEDLALAQLAPRPLTAQLAIYLDYMHYRIVGATLVCLASVLPSFLMMVALGWAYVHFDGLTQIQSTFCDAGTAVIDIIAISVYKLTIRGVGRGKLLWATYLLLAVVMVVTESEAAWLFLAVGVLVRSWYTPPR